MNARGSFFSWVSFDGAERVLTFTFSDINDYHDALLYSRGAFLSFLFLGAATDIRSQCNESYFNSILPSGSSTAEAAKIPAGGGFGQGAADIAYPYNATNLPWHH
jgi:hypothetical protein